MKCQYFFKNSIRLIVWLALTASAPQSFAQPSSFDRIVAFGTSLTDTGNSFIWLSKPENQACGISQNVPPYDRLDDSLIPEGPYAVGGHHYTNGATWLEGLARYLALAGNARPALQNSGIKGSNYAVGGARAIAGFPCRYNFPEQVLTYLNDFPSGISSNTLIVVEIGGNDIRDALVAAATGGLPAAVARLKDAIESVMGSLYVLNSKGAVKFLVMTVPDIGKIPAVRAIPVQGASESATELTKIFNSGLLAALDGFKSATSSNVRLLDAYGKFNEVMDNPSAFGFINTTSPCITPKKPPFKCKKPDTYVFWDGIHPTKAIHEIVAQEAIRAVSAP